MALGTCGLAAPAAGQDVALDHIDMQTAVDRAISWHPAVEEAIGRLRAQAEERQVAKAGYLPQISGGLGPSLRNGSENGWIPRANISASQMLYDFGKVRSNVRFAEAGDRLTRAQLLNAVDFLARDTSQAVIEAQRARAMLKVAEEQFRDISLIEEMVRNRHLRGAATKSDALQAKARVGGAKAEIQRIEGDIARWNGVISNYLGQTHIGEIREDVPDFLRNACDLGVENWSDVPAIMEVQAERDRALAEYERSKADRMPTLSLEGGAAGHVNDPLSNRTDYNIGLTVNSSIFNGGATGARARSAGYALSAATSAENRVRLDLGRVFSELREQLSALRAVRETLQIRELDMRETSSLYRLQYLEMGTRSLVDLLNAQQELHQLRFAMVQNDHDARRLQSECVYYSGKTRDHYALQGKKVQGVAI
jgi:adhesin transport system outer membrane protein